MKIDIFDTIGNVIYSHECEGNTFKLTIEKAVADGVPLICANLRWKELPRANFAGANFEGADFSSAFLWLANFKGANLKSANFSGADLNASDLSEADLSYAKCFVATLTSADLSFANFESADLQDADLTGAVMRGTNLRDVTRLPDLKLTNREGCSHMDKTAAIRIATALGWEPPKTPLSESVIRNLSKSIFGGWWVSKDALIEFTRKIEAAHGIKESK